jgi:hypothetical protein
VHGVQNIDVSELVDGHLQYRYLIGSVLRKIGFEDVDIAEVEHAEKEMKKQLEKEKKQREENESDARGEDVTDEEKKKMEAEVQKKSEQSYFQVMQEKTKSLNIGGFLGGGSKAEGVEKQEKAEHPGVKRQS